MNDHTLDSALIESQLNGDGDYIERKAAEYLLTLMDAIRVESSVAYRFCAAAAAVFSVKSLKEYGFLGGGMPSRKKARSSRQVTKTPRLTSI